MFGTKLRKIGIGKTTGEKPIAKNQNLLKQRLYRTGIYVGSQLPCEKRNSFSILATFLATFQVTFLATFFWQIPGVSKRASGDSPSRLVGTIIQWLHVIKLTQPKLYRTLDIRVQSHTQISSRFFVNVIAKWDIFASNIFSAKNYLQSSHYKN